MKVMIEQGEEHDYMLAYAVKTKELIDGDNAMDEGKHYVVIEYC